LLQKYVIRGGWFLKNWPPFCYLPISALNHIVTAQSNNQNLKLTNMRTNILKSIFVLGLGVFLSVGAVAQTTQKQQNKPQKQQLTPAQRQDKMLENYKKNLNLSDAQGRKLKAIQEQKVKDMQAIRNDMNLTRDQKQEKMKALHTANQQQITALLNAEQKQKFTEMQAKQEARKQEHMKNNTRGPRKGGRMQHKMPNN
jgi:hypothetical protein